MVSHINLFSLGEKVQVYFEGTVEEIINDGEIKLIGIRTNNGELLYSKEFLVNLIN